MPRAAYLAIPLGIAFGAWSELVGPGVGQPRTWVPDLLVGSTILVAGSVAWARGPQSRVGWLLVLCAVCWFVGNLAVVVGSAAAAPPLVGAVVGNAMVASHRALFAHALLSHPTGRLSSLAERIATLVAYASVLGAWIWPFGSVMAVIGLLIPAAAYLSFRRQIGPQRRAKLLAFRLAVIVAAAWLAGPLLRIVLGPAIGAEAANLVYGVAIATSSVVLASGILRPGSDDSSVADLVVELSEMRSGTLRDALAGVLGDPNLEVGYRVANGDSYLDASGRPVTIPDPSLGRTVTRIAREDDEVAVLIHDPAVLDKAAVVDAIAVAAGLAARNAELQAEVRGQINELRASRRRLVGAADAERERLAQRLSGGAMRRIEGLAGSLGSELEQHRSDNDRSSEARRRVLRAREQATDTVADLRRLAAGLHPLDLAEGGLASALHRLTEHSFVPIELAVSQTRLPVDIEAGIYFLCVEGIANATKHAGATRIKVSVQPGASTVLVAVSDDGIGGADPLGGTGLRGLADRIEALGGRLVIESPPTGGTRLAAALPL